MKTYSGVSVVTSFLGMAADMPESCRRILVCTKHYNASSQATLSDIISIFCVHSKLYQAAI
jgi:hypothetical protein